MSAPALQVLIADPQYLIREGLKQILLRQARIQVAAEASNQKEMHAWLRLHRPDVVVMDYSANGGFRPDDVRRIRRDSPQSEVLLISSDLEKEKVLAALQYGAKGFLTKECDEQEITDAVQAVSQKEKFFCNKVLDIILDRPLEVETNGSACDPLKITEREIDVIRCMAEGLKAEEIARQLNLSKHTVYTHRKNIKRKLALKTGAEIVRYAVQAKLV
jgi:DNA-binding NarL/FixJ family response regulator